MTFAISAPTILSFTMHADSTGFSFNNPMICEIKTYSFDQPWITALPPANPLISPF